MPGLSHILKQVARWTLPAGLYEYLRAVRRAATVGPVTRRSPEWEALYARNARCKGRHQGERCFILATGPSIREQDLTPLAGEVCFAVSHFCLHPDIRLINPRYAVIAPYHPPFTFAEIEKLFQGFAQGYSEETEYYFGYTHYAYSTYNYLQAHPALRRDTMYFIDYSAGGGLDESNIADPAAWDITGSPFAPRTVIYSAIQVAVYMGFSEIYLLGCDHDYLQDITRVTNHHFYREEDGVSDREHLQSFDLERWFGEYHARWKQYRLMRDYLTTTGCTIYNATQGGMLDVFPRVELSSLFQ